jgi:type IV secretory pathway VirB6-like protein
LPKLLSKITFQNYKAVLGKLLLLFLLLFSYSSCTDQGCIEADDFGEYEQEILFVKANALGESCEYDPTKALSDSLQGEGLKACFTSGNVVINDGVDIADHTSNTGCSGFEDAPTIKNLCIQECRQKCVNTNSSDSASAEPDWISTSKRQSGRNVGVTITPGAKVFIRAVGTVVLGGAKPETVFTRSSDFGLQSKKSDFTASFMDVTGGSVKDIKFSGKWNNGIAMIGGNINSTNIAEKTAAFNGANSLVAYVVPHPAGYKFDNTQLTELDGTRGVPLYVDTRLWTCSYNAGNKKQSLCSSLPYNADNQYPYTDNATALSIYNITSSSKASNLGSVGGMIRYDDDGLEPFDTDPFVAASCNPTCSGAPSDPKVGGFVGDLSAGDVSITNSENYAVRLVFKNLGVGAGSANCNTTLLGTIKNKDGLTVTSSAQAIVTNQSTWSSAYIALEAGDKIEFSANSAVYGATTTNCGNVIAYRFNKLQDIAINKSGFVSFTRLSTSGSSGSCSLNARIINPLGSRVDFNGANSADFYEYDSFSVPIASSIDPVKNLVVPISNTVGPFDKDWSTRFFVRKGQVIRFDPSSWNGTWISGSGGEKECGIGTAMQIEERPAFLCRGVATQDVPNPLCKQTTDIDGNKICQRYSDECFLNSQTNTPVNPSKYCPVESCQESFSSPCISSTPFTVSATTCSNCLAAKNAAGTQSTTISLDLKQCYDLENYQGKVANINAVTGFTPEQLDDIGISKGAKKIGSFDGNYGNFSSFVDDKTNEGAGFNNNKIYRLSQPALFAHDGRLKFLIIDSDSFDDNLTGWYADNGGSSSYDGLNGYKIDLSGRQEFRNGQWLEAILCQENSDDSRVCSSESIPIRINDQPDIVNIKDPLVSGQDPEITSYYELDPFGSILRFDNLAADHVSPESDINSLTNPGDNFYRHGYQYHADYTGMNDAQISDSKSKVSRLRISFKIKDPEIGNCDISNVNTGQAPFSQSCGGDCDGIVVENRFYDNKVSSNANAICASDKIPGHTVSTECQKQFFCANKYYNNEGKYQVIVKVENKGSNISDIVNKVISPVIEIMDGSADGTKMGQAERVYREIVGDGRFQLIVQMLVIVMITFFGVGYLMGVSEFSQSEIISRIIKIGVIYLFISPEGWAWFDKLFVNFFKHGTDYVTFLMASSFDRSTELQNAIATNSFYDKSILFSGIDKVFGMFFSSAVQKKISALLFASIFGWAYLYIIYLSFFLYVYAVANSVLLYLTAQVFISILFVLGPLFFLTLLFSQTKDMFDKWLGELIGFSLQQIFLLTTLAFFNMMMYEIMKMSLGYRVCWDDVWVINIYITRIKLLSFWTIASLPPRLNAQSEVGNIGNPEGIPSIFSILFIWIVASLMHKFIGFMTDLGASIGGSIKASDMAAGVKDAGNSMQKFAKSQYKKTIGDKIDSAMQSVDRGLFDSGKKADEERKKKQDQDKADSKNRSTLAKAGDEGISKYKRENAADYAKLSAPQQKEKLAEVRKKSMQDQAKAMGLDETATKKLIEGKSSITNARTLGGLVQEAWQKRGSLGTSLVDKDVKTSLSGSEMRDAMKNASDDDKALLQEKVDSGDMQVRVSSADRAGYNLDQAKEQMKDLKVGAALSSLAKAAGQTVKSATVDKAASAASNAKSAIKSGAKTAKNAVIESDEHKTARQDLEGKGEITRQAAGSRWARSDDEKVKIKEQMAENKKDEPVENKPVSKSTDKFMDKLGGKEALAVKEEKQKVQSAVDSVGSGAALSTIAEGDENADE